MDSLQKLKSGSDIRGIALGENINLTQQRIYALSMAFVSFLSEKYNKNKNKLKIAIGHDTRLSAKDVAKACIAGIAKNEASSSFFGLCSTPAMFYAVSNLSFDGAIEITASHLPFNMNGLKFFTIDGGLSSNDITKIISDAENILSTQNIDENSISADVSSFDSTLMEKYKNHLKNIIISELDSEKPLENLKICVDAGGGASGFMAEVFADLGADISSSQFLEPDGNFSNHMPNPEDEKAVNSIINRVKETNADLGVIYDTDVDRAGLILKGGINLTSHSLIAASAAMCLAKNADSTIVTDSLAHSKVTSFIERLGGKHVRFKRGYNNVISKAKELDAKGVDCPLAIECSGHAALKENSFLDDGAYLSIKLIIEHVKSKSLSKLIENFSEFAFTKEIRVTVSSGDESKELLDRLEQKFINCAGKLDTNCGEGIRYMWQGYEAIARNSVHDPVIVFNAFSDTKENLDLLIEIFNSLFTSSCSA